MIQNEPVFARAVDLHQRNKVEEALSVYDSLLAGPHGSDPHLQYAMGSAFAQIGRFGLAIDLLKRSVDAQPNNFEAWSNLGLSFRTLGQVPRAIECHERALGLPMAAEQRAGVLANLSGCFVNEGAPERALQYADQGLALKDMPQLHNHRSLALLELGRFDEGFAAYEQRVRLPEFTPRDYGKIPRWKGEDTPRLAIHGEQGLGDEILFLTAIKRVLERVTGEIHIECAARLVGLLRHSFREYPQIRLYPDHVALMSATTPTAWVPMGSLYHVTGGWTRWQYLQSSRQYLRGQWPRVGLSWRGGTLRTHEYYRNAPLENWKPLVMAIRAAGAEPISVQYGPAAEMAQYLDVPHDHTSIQDLDTLTGMIQSCDLIISVCNTTVHQAGAAGVPCWQLTPSKYDWRCAPVGSDQMHWYDSVKMIWQEYGEAWDKTLLRAAERVRKWGADRPMGGPVE